MITVFEKIPEIFVQRYEPQFEMWAREFQKRGNYAAIVFDRTPGQPVLLGADGKPVWRGAWFEADVDRSRPEHIRVVIKPRTGHDEELVERHCRELAPWMLH